MSQQKLLIGLFVFLALGNQAQAKETGVIACVESRSSTTVDPDQAYLPECGVETPQISDIYSSSPVLSSSRCTNSFAGMGCYAIEWKGGNMNVPFQNSNYPYCFPAFNYGLQASCLSSQEASTYFFPNGDPTGGWASSFASSADELAIGASQMMKYWQTPTFADLNIAHPGSSFPTLTGVVIKKINFLINSPFYTSMSELCFWPTSGVSVNPESYDFSCAFISGSYFDITSVDITYWDSFYGRQDLTLSGSEFAQKYVTGSYTYDPPEGVDKRLMEHYIKALVKTVKGNVRVRTPEGRVIPIEEARRAIQ